MHVDNFRKDLLLSILMIKLLDFWAVWCGPCKIMEPVIEEIEKELSGKVEIEKINVDEKPAKASEFGVMSIPTYIILKDGQEVARRIGVTSKAELLKLLQ
ncbi:MAG: Thioredoxin [Candidatus Daviesbacteria bacterium GW2011_GWF2_38_6]|uniref:Thioredoxin n=1 Tax=Candidatus Daviesbacteria bacterium GW2011_GWF2_38_6 TaxID=1618432 RepID=A0A0G0KH29_9BACT|nr:MAG: Thioredoxin [Candidatus Daviesbacteria bacterium GW2011_GWF2_38_6]